MRTSERLVGVADSRPVPALLEREVEADERERGPDPWRALADVLGFSTIWVTEHHFMEEYCHLGAPEIFLAAALVCTLAALVCAWGLSGRRAVGEAAPA